jgi:hypothetical protein
MSFYDEDCNFFSVPKKIIGFVGTGQPLYPSQLIAAVVLRGILSLLDDGVRY